MSVPEVSNTTESVPGTQPSAVKAAAMDVPETENTGASPHPEEATKTIVGGEPTPVPGKENAQEASKKSTTAEITPATEGVLGYKAPGIIQ